MTFSIDFSSAPKLPVGSHIANFTGHRPPKLGGYNPSNPRVKKTLLALRALIEHYIEQGVDTFITGMALGIDMWAARIVLALKETHPHIKLYAYVPCQGQFRAWEKNPQSIREWWDIIDHCDGVHYVSKESYEASGGAKCMQARNVAMVDDAHLVIAVWDGTAGGTGNCVQYAKDKSRSAEFAPVIVRLDPNTHAVSRA